MIWLIGSMVVMFGGTTWFLTRRMNQLRHEIRGMLPQLRKLGVLQDYSPLSAIKGAMYDVVDMIALMSAGEEEDEREHKRMIEEIKRIDSIPQANVKLMDYKTRFANEAVKLKNGTRRD